MRLGLQIIGFSIALAAATPLAIAETWTGVYLGGTIGRRTVDAGDTISEVACPLRHRQDFRDHR